MKCTTPSVLKFINYCSLFHFNGFSLDVGLSNFLIRGKEKSADLLYLLQTGFRTFEETLIDMDRPLRWDDKKNNIWVNLFDKYKKFSHVIVTGDFIINFHSLTLSFFAHIIMRNLIQFIVIKCCIV